MAVSKKAQNKKLADFQARNININFDDIDKYWFDNDPFKTRFTDALSTLFPDGERFFIETARVYRDQVSDPKLKEEITAFIRQEGQHGKLHGEYNDRLKKQGIDVDEIFERNKKILGRYRRFLSPKSALAITCALEHLTAIMGQRFMENMEMFDGADERVRSLFFWHGVEEIEHKAVCYDLYEEVAQGGYWRRVLLQAFISMMFVRGTTIITMSMLKHDGNNNIKTWRKGLSWLWGKKGVMRPLLKDYFQYYRPDFHPDQLAPPVTWKEWVDKFETEPDPIKVSSEVWQSHHARLEQTTAMHSAA